MAALRLRELEPFEQPPHFSGIVVLYRGLEMLPHRRGLSELPPEPPQKADTRLRHRSHKRNRTPAAKTGAAQRRPRSSDQR